MSKGVELPPGVSRVLEQIETKFRRLPHVFGVKLFNGANADIVRQSVQPESNMAAVKRKFPHLRVYIGQYINVKGYITILLGPADARTCRAI